MRGTRGNRASSGWHAALLTLPATMVLAGCVSVSEAPVAPVPESFAPAFPTEELVGSWGVASYHDDKDRERTEAMARQQCRNPYVIAKGPTDGVMMHAADDPKLYELKLKGTEDGRTYLGFEAPPGHHQDRIVLEQDPDLFVTRFVSPQVDSRYGTFIYVRCPA